MKLEIDKNIEIELPDASKGVNINKHWSVWKNEYYYTIEFYIDKDFKQLVAFKNTQSNTYEQDL